MEASNHIGLLKIFSPKAAVKPAPGGRENNPDTEREGAGLFDQIFGEAFEVSLSDSEDGEKATPDAPLLTDAIVKSPARSVEDAKISIAPETPAKVVEYRGETATRAAPERAPLIGDNNAVGETSVALLAARSGRPESLPGELSPRTDIVAPAPDRERTTSERAPAPAVKSELTTTIKLGVGEPSPMASPLPRMFAELAAPEDGDATLFKADLRVVAGSPPTQAAPTPFAPTAAMAAVPPVHAPAHSDVEIKGDMDALLDLASSPSNRAASQASGAPIISAPPPAAPTGIIPQILAAIQARAGGDVIEVRLDPPELGRILIDLNVEGPEAVRAVIAADRGETLDHLRRNIGELEEQLKNAGFGSINFEFLNNSQRQSTDKSSQEMDPGLMEFANDGAQSSQDKIYLTLRDGAQLDLLV